MFNYNHRRQYDELQQDTSDVFYVRFTKMLYVTINIIIVFLFLVY